ISGIIGLAESPLPPLARLPRSTPCSNRDGWSLPALSRTAPPGSGGSEGVREVSHQVESMLSVRLPAWHGLGVVLGDPPTVEDGLRLAGLDWSVSRKMLITTDGQKAPAFAIVRDSDQRVLGAVGERYRPLQNREAFAWFTPFLAAGEASLETAGS